MSEEYTTKLEIALGPKRPRGWLVLPDLENKAEAEAVAKQLRMLAKLMLVQARSLPEKGE